jgi:two-component sensor histidine kinase
MRTLSGSCSLDEARVAFVGRLHTLARANQQLANRAWRGASLNDVIQSELEPFAGRFKIDAEKDITLSPQAAQNFALAVHELATNAAKYGALSVPQGKVTIGWTIGAEKLNFRWQEREGPPVAFPRRKGFGTTLLSATLGDGLTQFPAEGFSYEIDLALSAVSARPAPDGNSVFIQTAASQY